MYLVSFRDESRLYEGYHLEACEWYIRRILPSAQWSNRLNIICLWILCPLFDKAVSICICMEPGPAELMPTQTTLKGIEQKFTHLTFYQTSNRRESGSAKHACYWIVRIENCRLQLDFTGSYVTWHFSTKPRILQTSTKNIHFRLFLWISSI